MIQEGIMPKARTQKIKGTPYVYIEHSFRVPGQSYPGHKRTYIGKMADDVFIPNGKFLALSDEEKRETGLSWEKPEVVPPRRGRPVSLQGRRVFGGTSLLFSTICDKLAWLCFRSVVNRYPTAGNGSGGL
jgi:hypothetical protein